MSALLCKFLLQGGGPQGFIEKKPKGQGGGGGGGGAKVEFIFFRGGNYKANQITFRLQTGVTVYVVFITCVVMVHLLKITP